jgi:hypothetical protein
MGRFIDVRMRSGDWGVRWTGKEWTSIGGAACCLCLLVPGTYVWLRCLVNWVLSGEGFAIWMRSRK